MGSEEYAHQGMDGTTAKPRDELHNVAKNIANCTELHLAKRGITHLTDDMEAFENLEVLWLNDNALSSIANLDFNPTIKSLYAHNNRIDSLKGSLLTFTFLHTLTLGNNHLEDLQDSLGVLRLMRHLRYLELSGNPLAEETGYRLLVIKNVPWLETLDMHKITDEERRAARRARPPKSWAVSAKGRGGDSVGIAQDLAAEENKSDNVQVRRRSSICVSLPVPQPTARRAEVMLQKELSRMRNVVKQRRILLKEWFRNEDPRREEAITQAQFTRCLRLYGLWPESDSHLDERSIWTEERRQEEASAPHPTVSAGAGWLRGLILESFDAKTPSRAPFLGRDSPYLGQRFVNYVRFCAAVEPKHGGRDLDNQERELDKAWREKSSPHGVGGRGGHGGQNDGKSRRTIAEVVHVDDGLENLYDDSEEEHIFQLPSIPPLACEFITKSQGILGINQRLDHWERLELKRAMEAEGGKASEETATSAHTISSAARITRGQALSAVSKMEELQGKKAHVFKLEPPVSVDDDSIFNQLSTVASGEGAEAPSNTGKIPAADALTISAEAARVGSTGGGRTNFDVLFDAAVAVSSAATLRAAAAGAGASEPSGRNAAGNPKGAGGTQQAKGESGGAEDVGIEDLLGVMDAGVEGAGGIGPLAWGWLSTEEAGKRSLRLYRQAAHAQRRMSLLADDDDAARRKAETIQSEIALLSRRAARLEALASHGRNQDGNHHSKRQHHQRQRVVGRNDIFYATEFHDGPFRRSEEDAGGGDHDSSEFWVGNDGAATREGRIHADSSGSCTGRSQTSLCSAYSGRTSNASGRLGTARGVPRVGEKGIGQRECTKAERPWFFKRSITVG